MTDRPDRQASPDGSSGKLGGRKLVLNRETLRKLEAGDLRQVVAGSPSKGRGCVLSHPEHVCEDTREAATCT